MKIIKKRKKLQNYLSKKKAYNIKIVSPNFLRDKQYRKLVARLVITDFLPGMKFMKILALYENSP